MITLCTGPMFSGKSTYLLQKIERSVYGKLKVCLVRPKKDTRGYFTHSGANLDSRLEQFISSKKLDCFDISRFTDDFVDSLLCYDTVLVDEFFMIKNCKKLIERFPSTKRIYFAGLISTSENELFDEARKVLPYADEIVKLNGVCMNCGSQTGSYSMYKGTKAAKLEIGDENKYECVCLDCYRKLKGTI